MVILIYRREVVVITPYELLELINNQYGPTETIQIVNDLIMEMDNDPRKYIHKLSEEVNDFALERYNLCPLCGEELVFNEYEENRGEYFGFSSQETMYHCECSNPECSYTTE